jgi:hypothetical protein
MNVIISARITGQSVTNYDSIESLIGDPNYDEIVWLKIENYAFISELIYPKELQQLYLKKCSYVYEHLGKLPDTITHVEINECYLHSIDKLFCEDQFNLEFIDLSKNRIDKISENFPTNIISVDLSYNELVRLPQNNCFPNTLQLLDLSFNKLKDLPEWIIDLNQNIVVNLMPNQFWFNSYTNISLNRTIHDYYLIMADRFFDSALRRKFEHVRQVMENNVINDNIDRGIQQNNTNNPQIYLEQINNRPMFLALDPNLHNRPNLNRRNNTNIINHNLLHNPINNPNQRQTTAEQKQNVHNSAIQDSFAKSVDCLMKNALPKNNDFYNSMWRYYLFDGLNIIRNLTFLNKVKADCELRDIITRVGVTYKEVMERIWTISETHEHKYEIRRILKDEVMDGYGVCFTGRITRVVNSLCGFIEGINIGYSINEQISNGIIAIMRRADNDPELNVETEVRKYLNELNIPEEQQRPWLEAL